MKPPAVYPVSADLSALLGVAVDVDAAWVEPLGPPTWPMPVLPIDPKAEAVVSELARRMKERMGQLRCNGFVPRGQR